MPSARGRCCTRLHSTVSAAPPHLQINSICLGWAWVMGPDFTPAVAPNSRTANLDLYPYSGAAGPRSTAHLLFIEVQHNLDLSFLLSGHFDLPGYAEAKKTTQTPVAQHTGRPGTQELSEATTGHGAPCSRRASLCLMLMCQNW